MFILYPYTYISSFKGGN